MDLKPQRKVGGPKKGEPGPMTRILEVLGQINEKLDAMEVRNNNTQPVNVSPPARTLAPEEVIPGNVLSPIQVAQPNLDGVAQYPVPYEYRLIVNELLNKNFNIEITPLSDSPAFQFTIFVPDKYSTVTKDYKDLYGRDMRPRVVTYSEGSVGVRSYVEKVWTSFSPTIQAMIVSDRAS